MDERRIDSPSLLKQSKLIHASYPTITDFPLYILTYPVAFINLLFRIFASIKAVVDSS